MAFDVSIQNQGDIMIFSLAGQIDISSSNHLGKLLYEAIEEHTSKIILDLSEVQFISSNGIGAIMESKSFIENNHGTFVLAGVNSKIYYIFQLIGVTEYMTCFDTIDEAVRSLSSHSRV